MKQTNKNKQESGELAERCTLLEEKNRDLVARVRTLSEENRSSEALIRTLLENTPFGILMIDEKQRVIQLNKAAEELLQIQRVNIIGKTCNTIFDCFVDNHKRCPVLHENQLLDRVETDCRSDVCDCDRHLLRSVVRIDNNNESILIEAFVDISPIKQAQLEIENANQTKDNFLSKISHELRTPLNVILGFSELLKDSLAVDPESDNSLYLHNILRSSNKLLRMVDELLDITRLTANRLKLDEYLMEIPAVLHQVCHEVQEQCDENKNKITVNCADNCRYIYADPGRLKQILYHLLDNACKFTHKGEITISVYRQTRAGAEWFVFAIKDMGEGMTAEQQARIFTEFAQADEGHTRRHGGAGLGLTLCKEISALMGGEISVTSTPGSGSEFILLLPDKKQLNPSSD